MALKVGVGLFTGQLPRSSTRTFHREYRDIVELVALVEASGLDSAWVSEHHGSADGYLPSLVPVLAACAAATERIELGTGVILAPFHDPLRLAEDFAVVDQLAGGRVICGLGIGWRAEEFRAFGISLSQRVGRLEEMVAIFRRAWSEDRFDFRGRHYSYEQVAVTPKPARVPPILLGGSVDAAVRRAGRIGDGYLATRTGVEHLRHSFRIAAEARAEAGGRGLPRVGVLQNAFVTNDPEGAWPMVKDGIGHQLGVYAGWRSGTDVPGVPLEVEPPAEDGIRSSTAYGTARDVVDHLAPVVDTLAPHPEAHLVLRLHYPGMEAGPAAEAIELLGRDVAPELRRRAEASRLD